MRRTTLVAVAFLVAATVVPMTSLAQVGSPQQDQIDRIEAAREWGDVQAPLPALRNAGPCPFVKTLYDAGRYIEFKDGREASAAVVWSGEIQGLSAGCEYKDVEPIRVTMEVLFELGKGPQARDRQNTYRYWVAVTDRNRSVIAKKFFDLPVSFRGGEDRVYVTETIDRIVIPRAEMTTSGSNFEILIGFEVTPQMAAFNRDGKRFRLNVGAVTAAANPAR